MKKKKAMMAKETTKKKTRKEKKEMTKTFLRVSEAQLQFAIHAGVPTLVTTFFLKYKTVKLLVILSASAIRSR